MCPVYVCAVSLSSPSIPLLLPPLHFNPFSTHHHLIIPLLPYYTSSPPLTLPAVSPSSVLFPQLKEISRGGQAMIQRLEDGGKPVVAAIHGSCLGGGMEVSHNTSHFPISTGCVARIESFSLFAARRHRIVQCTILNPAL